MRKEIEINGGDILSEKGKIVKKDMCYLRMFELDNILIEQYISPKGVIVKKYCTIIEQDKYYKANIPYNVLSAMLRPLEVKGFAAKSISYEKVNSKSGTTRRLGSKS
jgi:hypothetical protein